MTRDTCRGDIERLLEKTVSGSRYLRSGLLLVHADRHDIHWSLATGVTGPQRMAVTHEHPYHVASIGKTFTRRCDATPGRLPSWSRGPTPALPRCSTTTRSSERFARPASPSPGPLTPTRSSTPISTASRCRSSTCRSGRRRISKSSPRHSWPRSVNSRERRRSQGSASRYRSSSPARHSRSGVRGREDRHLRRVEYRGSNRGADPVAEAPGRRNIRGARDRRRMKGRAPLGYGSTRAALRTKQGRHAGGARDGMIVTWPSWIVTTPASSPRIAVGRVVLADRSPLALREVRAPAPPVVHPAIGMLEPLALGIERQLHGAARFEGCRVPAPAAGSSTPPAHEPGEQRDGPRGAPGRSLPRAKPWGLPCSRRTRRCIPISELAEHDPRAGERVRVRVTAPAAGVRVSR
jgi:hypothetical protein